MTAILSARGNSSRGVAMREKTIPAKVKNVILASPDIDIDVFRRQFMEMGPRRPHFAILTSPRDKALEVSGWLSGGVNRVDGTDLRPYAPLLKELDVSVIDTSAIAMNDPLGHNTFANSPEIVRLNLSRPMRCLLAGSKPWPLLARTIRRNYSKH